MSVPCEFLVSVGQHFVACGDPAVAILWWPLSRPDGTGERRARDTACCFKHAHLAAQLSRPHHEQVEPEDQ